MLTGFTRAAPRAAPRATRPALAGLLLLCCSLPRSPRRQLAARCGLVIAPLGAHRTDEATVEDPPLKSPHCMLGARAEEMTPMAQPSVGVVRDGVDARLSRKWRQERSELVGVLWPIIDAIDQRHLYHQAPVASVCQRLHPRVTELVHGMVSRGYEHTAEIIPRRMCRPGQAGGHGLQCPNCLGVRADCGHTHVIAAECEPKRMHHRLRRLLDVLQVVGRLAHTYGTHEKRALR
jgi:hypothetical protein